VVRCPSVSNLVCRVSTVVVNLLLRAARSAVVSLAMGGDSYGVGGDDVAEVGRGTRDVVEEDRLDNDTRLSRALMLKTTGSRLRSS
jgi:hypothetical protein